MNTELRTAMARAALKAVEEHGTGGATIAAIAERVGCSRRTFWNHFADMEEAVAEAVLPADLSGRLFPAGGADAGALLDAWERAVRGLLGDGSLDPLHRLGRRLDSGADCETFAARLWMRLIRAAQRALPVDHSDVLALLASAAGSALAAVLIGTPKLRGRRLQAADATSTLALDQAVAECFDGLRNGFLTAPAAR